MYIRYNSLNRNEPLVITLCNPGSVYSQTNNAPSKAIGILADTSDEELVLNFNQISELNFRVTRVHRSDAEKNAHTYNLYKSIQTRRLLYVTGVGYFSITEANESEDELGCSYKDVRASSVESEIQNKKIPYIANNTYRFSTNNQQTEKGLLETLVETLPLWTIGEIDEAVQSRYRTFEDVNTDLNVLSFMLDNMQNAYECIFIFDIINRIINVYDQGNYVRRTNIHITKDDLIRHISIIENADDIYTAISVLGDDNTTIGAVNPLGGNVIYNFTHYLSWMQESLRDKVVTWQDGVREVETRYRSLNLEYYNMLEDASHTQAEIQRLESVIALYKRCRDCIVAESGTDFVSNYNSAIVSQNGNEITIYAEISDTLNEIDRLMQEADGLKQREESELSSLNVYLSELQTEISEIYSIYDIKSYFTQAEYDELANYIFEGSYKDDYVVITDVMTYPDKFEQMRTLYNRARTTLEKASAPTQEFKIDVENFVFSKEFEQWVDQIETGCLINVELDTDNIAWLFLSNITVNYSDQRLSMTFGNRFNKFDAKALFDNMLGKINKSANTLNYIKEILYPIKSGELNSMREALNSSRNFTMNAALSSSGEEVIIDDSGYTAKKKLDNGTFDPRQVKITGKSIVFTDDAWQSCKVAIGELLFGENESAYGINAQCVMGDIVMGNNLRILDSNGKDLMSVVDEKITTRVGDIGNKMTEFEQNESSMNIRIQNLESFAENGVDSVTTKTGYTFDADGLKIYKTGEEIKNLLDHTGMYVTRSVDNTQTEILTANNEGVNAINLTARQYLIVGNSCRFESYTTESNEVRTACFFTGI